jgi:hypothetical protein
LSRHKKLVGGAILLGAVLGGIGLNAYQQDQQRIDQLKAHEGSDAAAKAFNDRYGARLAGPGNVFNSSVLSLYDVHVDNSTLAQIVEQGARTAGGDLWGTVSYVAGHLDTPQYMPKTEEQAAACSKIIKGVENITESDPRLLTGLFHRAPSYIVAIGAQFSADKVSEAYDGIKYVAKYAMKILSSGNATLDGLEGKDLENAVLPIGLAVIDIQTGLVSRNPPETFKKNTYPDANLGRKSPLAWQGQEVRKNLQGGPKLDRALWLGYRTNRGGTLGEPTTYHEVLKTLSPAEQKIIEFIYGIGGLNVEYGIPHVEEIDHSSYAQSVGFHFFRPIRERYVNYPGSKTGHNDMDIWSTEYNGYVGPMMDPKDLAKAFIDANVDVKYMDLREYDGSPVG